MRSVPPVSPREMLEEAFLKPLGLTKYRLAKDIGVPPQRIGDIVAGKRAVTADTDLGCAAISGSATAGGNAGRPATTRPLRARRCEPNSSASALPAARAVKWASALPCDPAAPPPSGHDPERRSPVGDGQSADAHHGCQ